MSVSSNAVVSVVVSSVNTNGKKESMSFSDINPESTNSNIYDFATMLLGFSTNYLSSVSKVTKEEVYSNA